MQKSPLNAAKQGFTLVEVMMASFVLVTVLLSTLTALMQGFALLDTARNTTLAAQIIESQIEDLRLQPWTTINGYSVDTNQAIDLAAAIGSNPSLSTAERNSLAQRFSITRRFTNISGRTGLASDGTTVIPTFKRVSFSIAWHDYNNRSHTRSYETLLGYNGLSDYFAATHAPNTP